MTLEIQTLQKWLAQKYLNALNLPLIERGLGDGPVYWVYEPVSEDHCAELLDSQLGIWIRFRCFTERTSSVDLPKYVGQDVQWGLKNMASLTRRSGINESDVDQYGGWQIHLIWLVQANHYGDWCKSMHELRSQSGYSEELGVDAVLYYDSTHLESSLNEHGLPQLLTGVRQLLGMASTEVESWTSANKTFEDALTRMPADFSNRADSEFVRQYVNEVLNQHHIVYQDGVTDTPALKRPQQITISNFRNIEHAELRLSSPLKKDVHVTVVHGPNGSGKSSLFEALCIGVAGVSSSFWDYIQDQDLTASEKAQYINRVLKRFGSSEQPSVFLDEADGLTNLARSADEASSARINTDGTFLAQEDARNWVFERSSALGARILSGYSTLAQVAQARVESEFQKANQARQDWLRKYGLSAQITKRETRLQKLVSHFVADQFPRAPQQINDWLKAVYARVPEAREEANALATEWMRVDGHEEREDLALQIANAERAGLGAEILATWLSKRANIVSGINALIARQATYLQKLAANFSDIQQDLDAWHRWLLAQEQADKSIQPVNASLQQDEQKLVELSKQLSDLTERGRQLRMQFDHMHNILQDQLPAWAETHPNTCPTCNTDHAEGILKVVHQLKSQLEKQINALRKEYAEKQELLKKMRAQQATRGKCPVPEERKKELAGWLRFPSEGPESLEADLRRPQYKERLLSLLQQLIAAPSLVDLVKMSTPASENANRVMGLISQEDARGEELWILPERWSQIKKRTDEVALRIVREHLPLTLEAVWRELVFFLTPARWNVAGEPKLKADLARGDQKLRVVIEPKGNSQQDGGRGLLARYTFNQAEQHVLGLAWFFTRYLTHGRFVYALIALDDPAQEMDQTTYRGFVRWLQVLTRLHAVNCIPLSLITFLHQEDRALDLARATSQQVMMLRWAKTLQTEGPNSTVHHLVLRNDEQRSPVPQVFRVSRNSTPIA